MKNQTETYIEDEIAEVLLCAGIPANMRGFRYLKTAVKLVYFDPSLLDHMVDQLYTQVGKEHNSKSTLVERCIRHCISRAFAAGVFSDIPEFAKFKNKKPCNGEAIVRFCEIVTKRVNQKGGLAQAPEKTVSTEKYEALKKELELYKKTYGSLK